MEAVVVSTLKYIYNSSISGWNFQIMLHLMRLCGFGIFEH